MILCSVKYLVVTGMLREMKVNHRHFEESLPETAATIAIIDKNDNQSGFNCLKMVNV